MTCLMRDDPGIQWLEEPCLMRKVVAYAMCASLGVREELRTRWLVLTHIASVFLSYAVHRRMRTIMPKMEG